MFVNKSEDDVCAATLALTLDDRYTIAITKYLNDDGTKKYSCHIITFEGEEKSIDFLTLKDYKRLEARIDRKRAAMVA